MSTAWRAAVILLGGLLLLGAPSGWAQDAPVAVPLAAGEDSPATPAPPQGEVPLGPIGSAPETVAGQPWTGAMMGFDPVERAWFAAGGSLEDRVQRTFDAALRLGRPNLEGPARALLLEDSLGTPLQRAEAAVKLAPELPAARIALGEVLWREKWDLLGALDQVRLAARASARDLEASAWFRATIAHFLVITCVIGSLLFLFVAGGSLVASTAHALACLPGSMPLASRAALVAGLLLIPAVLGEGIFGVALAFAAVGFWRGTTPQRIAVGAAVVVLIAGLFPLANRAGEELVALGSDPIAEAAFAVEHGQPSQSDLDRLERAGDRDPLARSALALHAKRSGDLQGADRRFTALLDESAHPSSSLLNNAANVRMALGRTEEAVELYEAAARHSHRVVPLFNLSHAYGRLIQLERQDLALAEAQAIDPAGVSALSSIYGSSREMLVEDLPVEAERIRDRLRDPVAGQRAATALRRRFAPGWLGVSPVHGAAGVALVVLLGSGIALVLRKLTAGGEGGGLYAGIASLLTGGQSADPLTRTVRLTALRERQARVDKLKLLVSALVPGVAGVFSRLPILGLLGSLLFASILASWWAREGVVADPLAVGAGGSLFFGAVSAASAVAYAVVVGASIALRERS